MTASSVAGRGVSPGVRAVVAAYVVAGCCALLAIRFPVAVITSFEGQPGNDAAGGWVARWLLVGVALIVIGSAVRRRGHIGVALGVMMITCGVLCTFATGALAMFGIDAVIEFWDSDAVGRPGSGRAYLVVGSVAVMIGLTIDSTSRGGRRQRREVGTSIASVSRTTPPPPPAEPVAPGRPAP